jgi:thiosulfate reductase cytochrome b subunit
LAAKSAQANIGSLASLGSLAPVGGDVNLKTIAGWAVVAFIVWWVIEQPTDAAHLVHNIGDLLSTAATGLSHFVASI